MPIILIPAVFLTAALSGAIGMGGGVTLLAVLAASLAPPVVVPVHGAVQAVSNLTRSLALLRRVDWQLVLLYTPTMAIGAFLGLGLYTGSDMSWFRPLIGVFVLAFLLWERVRPARLVLPRWAFVPAGLGGGLITILIGASGPYLAAFFLRDDLDREQIVATKAAIQTLGHLIKIPAFLSIGFPYREQLALIAPLVLCAIAGTLAGTHLLRRMGERVFAVVFRLALTALALRLLIAAL